jgi:hypothetical protein
MAEQTRDLRFSISVPVGAYHPLLSYNLRSLRAQRQPMSVSLLDASGDSRVTRLADEFADVIAYRRHGPDGGQAAAIVEGWERGGGEILAWLNADDILFPGALEAAADALLAGEADLVYGHSAICDEQMRLTGYHWAVTSSPADLPLGCNISQPSCFFRRSACEAAGGLDASLHFTMDWDLWLRMQAGGARFAFMDAPWSSVYWGEGTKTSGFNARRRQELWRLIDRYAPSSQKARLLKGFALQAGLDRLRPPGAQRFVRERLAANRPRVFGVGPDGRLGAQASIIWFHLEAEPRSRLHITVSNDASVEVSSLVPIRTAARGRGTIEVEFARPVPSGEVVRVDLRPGASRPVVRLRRCEWRA